MLGEFGELAVSRVNYSCRSHSLLSLVMGRRRD